MGKDEISAESQSHVISHITLDKLDVRQYLKTLLKSPLNHETAFALGEPTRLSDLVDIMGSIEEWVGGEEQGREEWNIEIFWH